MMIYLWSKHMFFCFWLRRSAFDTRSHEISTNSRKVRTPIHLSIKCNNLDQFQRIPIPTETSNCTTQIGAHIIDVLNMFIDIYVQSVRTH